MIHQHIFASPRPGLSEAGFHHYWNEIHATQFASKIPQFQKYLINNRIDCSLATNPPIWNGIAEIWFANEADQLASLQSDEFLLGARLDEPKWAAFWNTLVVDTDAHVLLDVPRNQRSHAVKFVRLLRRKQGIRVAEFRRRLSEDYGPQLLRVPGLKGCTLCTSRDSGYAICEPRFDGVVQSWFESIEALEAAGSTPQWKEAEWRLEDFVNADQRFSMAVKENWIIPSDAARHSTGSHPAAGQSVAALLPWDKRPRSGAQAIAEQLRAAELIGKPESVLIGNPGSGEEWLYLEMVNEVRLGLCEPAVGTIVDGASRFRNVPAVAIAHGFVGLSGLQGAIFNAAQRQSPMLVIVGVADTHAHAGETHMWADIEGAAKASRAKFVKAATDSATLIRDLRDAIIQAMIPPFGPVVFIVGSDVAATPNNEPVYRPRLPNCRLAPPISEIEDLAKRLLQSQNLAICVGDGVARSQAHAELQEVAELLGADVWASMESQVNLPRNHPLFRGNLGHMDAHRGSDLLRDADMGLVVGTPVYQTVFNSRSQLFPPGAPVAAVNYDTDTSLRGHNDISFPMLGDPKRVLAELAEVLRRTRGPDQAERARRRIDELARTKREALEKRRHEQLAQPGVNMGKFGAGLERRMLKLPQRPVIFNEALVGAIGFTDHIENPNLPGMYYDTSGGSLGEWGGCVGVALTGIPTIGVIGDGGFHYVLPAIWNAARERAPLGLVLTNNGTYGLLYENLKSAFASRGLDPQSIPYPHFYQMPAVDYVQVVEGYGVAGMRVEREDQIEHAINKMIEAIQYRTGPFLIDLVLSR